MSIASHPNIRLFPWPRTVNKTYSWRRPTDNDLFDRATLDVRHDIAAIVGEDGAVAITLHSTPHDHAAFSHVTYRQDRVLTSLSDDAPECVLLACLVHLLLYFEGYPSLSGPHAELLSSAMLAPEIDRRVALYDKGVRRFNDDQLEIARILSLGKEPWRNC